MFDPLPNKLRAAGFVAVGGVVIGAVVRAFANAPPGAQSQYVRPAEPPVVQTLPPSGLQWHPQPQVVVPLVARPWLPDTPNRPGNAWPVPIQIGRPVVRLHPDPLTVATPGNFQGELVYMALVPRMIKGEPVLKPVLVLRHIADQHTDPARTYELEAPADVFYPEFSPDGQFILLRCGHMSERWDRYGLFILDVQKQKVEFGPGLGISYYPVRWSPDSKALAFVYGGDVDGEPLRNGPVPVLYIYHLDTGRSVRIAQNASVIDFAFADQQTLLYTVLNETAAREDTKGAAASMEGNITSVQQYHPPHPAIYQSLQHEDAGKLLIIDGYQPVPSPNGRWVAFYGWSVPKDDAPGKTTSKDNGQKMGDKPKENVASPREQTHSWPSLYLFDRFTHQRTLLMDRTFDEIRWTPDSKFLITMETRYYAGNGTATLSKLNIWTRKMAPAGIVKAHDSVPGIRQTVFPMFQTHGFSRDGRSLFLRVDETGPLIKSFNAYPTLNSWQEVDLKTGVTRIMCRFDQVSGYDWHEQ